MQTIKIYIVIGALIGLASAIAVAASLARGSADKVEREVFEYNGDIQSWIDFISCLTGDNPRPEVLGGSTSDTVQRLESNLGLTLPRSYAHFLTAYEQFEPAEVLAEFDPAKVDMLAKVEPDLVDLYEEFYAVDPIYPPDSTYLVYGSEQDDSLIRVPYLRNAIRIAKDHQSTIVLFQDLQDSVGEMETAMLFESSSFRAPNFALAMQHFAAYLDSETDSVPPYPREDLAGTCAEHLF